MVARRTERVNTLCDPDVTGARTNADERIRKWTIGSGAVFSSRRAKNSTLKKESAMLPQAMDWLNPAI
jgi:hypothetical protein